MIFLRLLAESLRFAWHALTNNRLRTFLSLLGVTIGILAIISVFTIVDSLEKNVRDSINKLGSDVIYIQKWPWTSEDRQEYKWWEFMKRPQVKYSELGKLQKRMKKAEAIAFTINADRLVQYKSNSVENTSILGATYDWPKTRSFELISGRYFTLSETLTKKNYAILGYDIAMALFDSPFVLGEQIKIGGKKATVIGVFDREGQDITGNSTDELVVCPIIFAQSFINYRYSDPSIVVKAKKNINNQELRDELRGVMRSLRKLKPTMPDNFALNEISLVGNQLDSLFSVIGLTGWIIGGFSILVGGFGIANIMFVSVKERTKLIGIQKALGARNSFILIQFLFESVFLCLLGGVIGLILVSILAWGVRNFSEFNIQLSMENIILGLSVSAIIGIVSGIVPALSASKLDPVEAIRR